jgi:hypothetical protein
LSGTIVYAFTVPTVRKIFIVSIAVSGFIVQCTTESQDVLFKPKHYFPYQWVKSEEETQTLVVTVLQGIAAGSLLFVGFLEVK